MFGLSGRGALFDTLFDEAGRIWVKVGYTSDSVPSEQARDINPLRELYGISTDINTRPAIATIHFDIQFDPNKGAINESGKRLLDGQNVELFVRGFSNANFRIEVNSDDTGDKESSRQLNLVRARAIVDYLAQRYDMAPSRFIVASDGSQKPIAANDTPKGRTSNARIDIGAVPVN
jgi:outer membrane protein OmpA-like peptidoglycan-associated protein